MNKVLLLYIFLVFLLNGAASQTCAATIAEASMGHDVPTVGNYDLSGMTEEEKEWFITFLEGNFFADGWKEISSNILASTSIHEREEQKERLDKLGFKIGSEWSKKNESRKIDTDFLRKWGKELRDTAEETPHLLTEVISRIDSEVDKLLN